MAACPLPHVCIAVEAPLQIHALMDAWIHSLGYTVLEEGNSGIYFNMDEP